MCRGCKSPGTLRFQESRLSSDEDGQIMARANSVGTVDGMKINFSYVSNQAWSMRH